MLDQVQVELYGKTYHQKELSLVGSLYHHQLHHHLCPTNYTYFETLKQQGISLAKFQIHNKQSEKTAVQGYAYQLIEKKTLCLKIRSKDTKH